MKFKEIEDAPERRNTPVRKSKTYLKILDVKADRFEEAAREAKRRQSLALETIKPRLKQISELELHEVSSRSSYSDSSIEISGINTINVG